MGLTGSAILQLHPTRRCNLRCLHCYSESGPYVAATTALEVLRDAVTDAAELGYTVVSISGGEPLLYPQLPGLLRHAKSLGLGTTVTSNGMLMTERRLGELAGLVDVLALSLDGRPETHDRMRGDARAFRTLDSRMAGVRASGIPFGFITTLTMDNVAEVEWVVGYAKEHGAGLVQIHPLEPEGAAARNLDGSVPDLTESAFAVIEGARLEAAYELTVQVDIARRSELVGHPHEFLVEPPSARARLSDWLTPLVVETDGTVVPLTYGFAQRYALGSLLQHPLRTLAGGWDPTSFLDLTRRVGLRLAGDPRPLFNWYDELAAEAKLVLAPV